MSLGGSMWLLFSWCALPVGALRCLKVDQALLQRKCAQFQLTPERSIHSQFEWDTPFTNVHRFEVQHLAGRIAHNAGCTQESQMKSSLLVFIVVQSTPAAGGRRWTWNLLERFFRTDEEGKKTEKNFDHFIIFKMFQSPEVRSLTQQSFTFSSLKC